VPDWRRYRDFFGPNPERDLAEEVRFHLETEIDELIAEGLTADQARQRAYAHFGDVDRFVAECRESDRRRLGRQRRASLVDLIRDDVRQAMRGLVRRPAFAATTILVLAIGIGANAAVFSIVDHVFLRAPAVVRHPSEVTRVFVERRRENATTYFQVRFSFPEARIIDSVVSREFPSAIFFRRDVSVDAGGTARPMSSAWVSPTYFSVLGVGLFAGSAFDSDAGGFGVPATSAIISWSLWQHMFAADPEVIGRTIRVGGRPVTVRGIAPPRFSGIDVDATDIWLPIAGFTGFDETVRRPWVDDWGLIAFRVLARVPEGSTDRLIASVEAAVRTSAREASIADPQRKSLDAVTRVIPAPLLTARGPERLSQREALAAVLAALAFLLLIIAVANVANLLVGRALDRQRETAVRLALGMSRVRIYTQVAIESIILAGAAIVAGGLAAVSMGTALRRMVFPSVDFASPPVDARIALAGIALGLGAALVASIAPLRPLLRVDLTRALKTGSRDGGGRRSRARAVLLGVQAALSAVLLVGTALFGRSLYNIRTASLGLNAGQLVVVKAPEDDALALPLTAVAELARSLPGVTSVSLAGHPPLWDQFEADVLFTATGDSVRGLETHVGYVAADASYLATVGTRVVRGRDFTPDDRLGANPVMIVSETLAGRVWPASGALGACLRIGSADDPCRTVVGIVEDARRFAIVEEPHPTFYIPLAQRPGRTSADDSGARAVVARVTGEPALVLSRLRAELGDTATTLRGRRVIALSEVLAPQYGTWEVAARLFAGLSVLAVSLAIFGLYGVLAYVVSLRAHELGVRATLGAGRGAMVGEVVGEAVRHIGVGIVAGVLIAAFAASRLEPLLFEVSPHDPPSLLAAVAVLIGGAALAAIVPARRAMAVDPAHALKDG
jgi:predicted permease